MRYDFSVTGETSKVMVTFLIPQSLDRRQKVRSIEYSAQPDKIFSANGSRYAQFVFDQPRGKHTIEVKARVDVYRYDLTMARCDKERPKREEKSELEKYLVVERFIDSDYDKIKLTAALLNNGGEIERIRNIFDFVLEHLRYAGYLYDDQGAIKTFESGRGDCTDYTDLFVALCRANGIPARHVQGFLAFSADTLKHSWAEVYTEQFGWVPFDVLQTDLKQQAYRFEMMKNRNIYLSCIRNDPSLMGKYSFWYYRYWGDAVKVVDTYKIEKINTGERPN
ncbi:MAG: transglutaminase-like domain-containing protein [Planctomycetota bacterium]|jgi:hypothetical protein